MVSKARAKGKSQEPPEKSGHKCSFCNRIFTWEKTLFAHVCEQKRRFQSREDRHVSLAFKIFQRVCSVMKTKSTWDHFEKSQMYGAFVKFGRYIYDIHAINPMAFVDFLLRVEAKIDQWCAPSYYDAYVRELTKIETPMDALSRNILLMQQWAQDSNEHWTDFFRKVAPAQAVAWINSGRLSPWVLFLSGSAGDLLNRLSAEQMGLISKVVDPDYWGTKMSLHPKEVDAVREILDEAGI
jgi:hypothetical protein